MSLLCAAASSRSGPSLRTGAQPALPRSTLTRVSTRSSNATRPPSAAGFAPVAGGDVETDGGGCGGRVDGAGGGVESAGRVGTPPAGGAVGGGDPVPAAACGNGGDHGLSRASVEGDSRSRRSSTVVGAVDDCALAAGR